MDNQDRLAALRHRCLERNDEIDPGGRVYIHKETGDYYFSVTRILSATASEAQKKALEKWLERPNSIQDRDMAAARGTAAHNQLEYITKTASRLVRSTATKRGVFKIGSDGLYRAPAPITLWALQKAIQGAPRCPWSASGFARGLRGYLLDRIVALHSTEFSIHHVAGFAGTCDLLADVKEPGTDTPKLTIVDYKTTGKSIHSKIAGQYDNYKAQLGAYSLGLRARTGIQAEAGALVIARRSGAPQEIWLNKDELLQEEKNFLERVETFLAAIEIDSQEPRTTGQQQAA